MTIKSKAKQAAGFIKEELYEHGTSAKSRKKAQEARDLRNEGRMEEGESPLKSPPGTSH